MVMRAFWSHGGFQEFKGANGVLLLSFLAHRRAPEPESVNTLAKKLKMRWGTVKDTLDALEDAKYIHIRRTPEGLVIRVIEPPWLRETTETHAP